MKKFYGPIVMGLAVLMASTPIITTTNVQASGNTAVTQSGNDAGDQAFRQQEERLLHFESNGNFNAAQLVTLEKLQYDTKQKSINATDSQKLQIAKDLKTYLDKGVVDYSATLNDTVVNVNNINDYVDNSGNTIYDSPVYTFKQIDQPEMKPFSVKGFTIVDRNGKENNGQVPMHIDAGGQIHLDNDYLIYIGGDPQIRAVRNGESATAETPSWTSWKQVVTTQNGISYLYRLDGHLVKNRALGPYSSWFSDRYATINGKTMYRVATNEWVDGDNI